MWQLIDTLTCNEVVGEYLTHRKALNASRKIEPEPTARDGYDNLTWRFQIRKETK
jgi:hypothetical protein